MKPYKIIGMRPREFEFEGKKYFGFGVTVVSTDVHPSYGVSDARSVVIMNSRIPEGYSPKIGDYVYLMKDNYGKQTIFPAPQN